MDSGEIFLILKGNMYFNSAVNVINMYKYLFTFMSLTIRSTYSIYLCSCIDIYISYIFDSANEFINRK